MKHIVKLFCLVIVTVLIGCGSGKDMENYEKNELAQSESIDKKLTPTNSPTPLATNTSTPTPDLVQQVRDYIEDADMLKASETIDLLDDYEMADKLRKEIKYYYATNDVLIGGMYVDEITCQYDSQNENEIEEALSNYLYGIWYDEDDNIVNIDEYSIGDKTYCFYGLYLEENSRFPDDECIMVYSFVEEPEKLYCLSVSTYDYGIAYAPAEKDIMDTTYKIIGNDRESVGYDIYLSNYSSATSDEISEKLEAEAQKNQEESRNNEQKRGVYKQAKNEFQAWLDQFYTPVEQMYLIVNYDDVSNATYYYDENMGTYELRMQVTVVESWIYETTYTVTIECYVRNGYLITSDFNVY